MKESRTASIKTDVILILPGRGFFCVYHSVRLEMLYSVLTHKHLTIKRNPCFGGHDTVTSLCVPGDVVAY